MRAIVLGATGQLGSDLLRVNKVLAHELELIPLTRDHIDLTNLQTISSILNQYTFEVLINCTGFNRVDDADVETQQAMIINANAVEKMAEVCRSKRARFIHVSTDFVFSGDKSSPYVEEDLPAPISLYGASKALGELMARFSYQESIIVRTASLFGVTGSRGKGSNFVETVIRLGRQEGRVKVVNDLTMSPTSSFDLAKIIFKLIETEAPPGIYHAVNSGQATWEQFAQEIVLQASIRAELVPVSIQDFSRRARRPHYSVLNNSKIASIVGDIPHWKTALKQYLYERNQRP